MGQIELLLDQFPTSVCVCGTFFPFHSKAPLTLIKMIVGVRKAH